MCKEVRFSTGGQFFGAVNNSAIQIYNSYTAENIGNLRQGFCTDIPQSPLCMSLEYDMKDDLMCSPY